MPPPKALLLQSHEALQASSGIERRESPLHQLSGNDFLDGLAEINLQTLLARDLKFAGFQT